ncbi:putative membrane protein [Deinococcus metalli]|nr:DUF4142 domain-containing protein [Deinococcus metalli]MBB5376389.1 putative membrane protein [Deinococcus metalli]
MQAALSDMFEIRSSQLAATRSGNAKVKALAQQLIKDHTDASRKLAALAPRLNIRLPTAPDPLKAAELTALGLQQGEGFDRAYLAAQVTAHEQAVNLFTAYGKSGAQAQLKAHATSTLPALQKHLQTARDLFKGIAQ